MPGHDIIVMGASAGGVEVLKEIVSNLPQGFPAAVFIVLHVPSDGSSVLPRILTRRGPLPAFHPEDNAQIQNGHIYIAPPDSHLLIKRGHIRLAHGPKENGFRPAIDPLFRTAAVAYGSRVIGVVLSGTLDDGTAGLASVKERGGLAVVHDPDDALYSGMPLSAIENVAVDYVAPASDLASILMHLVNEPAQEGESMSNDMEMEADIAELDEAAMKDEKRPGTPSRFTCPECSGVLWELDEDDLLRFRCRVGHAYSAESLLSGQFNGVEAALWAALRALDENISLSKQLAARLRKRGHERSAARFEEQAKVTEGRAETLRQVLVHHEPQHPAEVDGGEMNSPARGGSGLPQEAQERESTEPTAGASD